MYKVDVIKNKGDIIEELKINKGTKTKIKISIDEDLIVLKKKSELSKKYDIKTNINDLKLPIKKGDIVGRITIKDNGKNIKTMDLISMDSVEKLGYFKTLFATLKDILTGKMFVI